MRAHVAYRGTRRKPLLASNLAGGVHKTPFGPALAHPAAASPQEAEMFIWMVILAMGLVGGYWVKTRRQRKTKASTYVGN